MKTLILSVDRDDDIGTKAGIKGPIIGREDNLNAAMKLGLADPEDSDVNTVLSAVTVYDERIHMGEDAEVATITGDVRVGTISDRVLIQQLERVLEEVKPDRVFLVSDGAEDEYIFPVVSSRIRVDHVRRVIVRQTAGIESTYYTLVRAMRNPKVRRKVVFPVGLALVVFSAIFLTAPELAPAIVTLAIGLYLLVISLPFSSVSDLVAKATAYYGNLRSRFAIRDFSVIFNIVAFIFVLLGVSFGVDLALTVDLGLTGAAVTQMLVRFLLGSLWWFMVAVLTFEFGKAVTAYLQRGRAPKHTLVVAGSFIAIGLVIFGLVQILQGIFGGVNLTSALPLIFTSLGMAILIVIVAAFSYRGREEKPVEDSWRH